MYKLLITKDAGGNQITNIIKDNGNGNFTSFQANPDNTDYQAFRQAILDSTSQLENADGTLMTADDAIAFVETLPQGVTL